MKIILFSFLLLSCSAVFGQVPCELSPEMEASFTEEIPIPLDLCFDISDLIDNCTPVYIRVNIHFFLDNDCDGNLATHPDITENLSPYNAFALAEDLVDNANEFFDKVNANTNPILDHQWNSEHHNTPVTSHQCIPVRYVLGGAYIHCSSVNQDVELTEEFDYFDNYAINPLTEVNVYVSNFITGDGNGFADNGSNQVCVENFTSGLFNHELGHVFNLAHTFIYDRCDDTWIDSWRWDRDCNGTFETTGKACWWEHPDYPPLSGIDACDINNFCQPHPCCDWKNISNNLMTYSSYGYNGDYSALTPCQLNLMITDISDQMCDYVAAIDPDCPPVNSNIGVIPTTTGDMQCPACFYLNASDNENKYSVTIMNSSGSRIIESGVINSEAGKYCITPRTNKDGQLEWPNGLVAGQTYTIKLKVFNSCEESDESQLNFTLPYPCALYEQDPNDVPDIEMVTINPNPATGNITVKFNLNKNEDVIMYGLHPSNNTVYGIVYQNYHMSGDNQTVQLSLSQWASGYNSLVVRAGNDILIENFIKL